MGRLATAWTIAPGDVAPGFVVDIHFATAGIEAEIVAAAEVHEVLPDLWMPVATAGHLVALKLLDRDDETLPQDAADLRALQSVLDADEHRMVRATVGLIVERGYARDRPLVALAEHLARRPGSAARWARTVMDRQAGFACASVDRRQRTCGELAASDGDGRPTRSSTGSST